MNLILASFLTMGAPLMAVCAAGVLFIVVIAAWVRQRAMMPQLAWAGVSAGLFFALAAGSMVLHLSGGGRVVVMVDLSPSTRGADYRQPGVLQRRIGQLIGDRPFVVIQFGESNRAATIDSPLEEIASQRTNFDPPTADAVVVFSDGRFAAPAYSPPVYFVVDAGLEHPADAAVRKMEMRGGEIAVTVESTGRENRILTISGDSAATQPAQPGSPRATATTHPVAAGESVIVVPVDGARGRWRAEVSGGDLWPENDALTLDLPPPMLRQRWWIGDGTRAPAGWIAKSPDDLPMDELDYLTADVIVLDNVSASELSAARMSGLERYVRDCGGSVVILGGDKSFGAGLYSGTPLERLSPLASVAPSPAQRWMFLLDFSGSMSNPAENAGNPAIASVPQSNLATAAVQELLPRLPPDDPVTIGSFSDRITWWVTDRAASELSKAALSPPAGVVAAGPTNLEPALNQIAAGDSSMPVNLLLLSDADVQIDHPAELAAALARRHVRLFVLALARGSGLGVLQQLASATGGYVLDQSDPTLWPQAARQLLRGAMTDAIGTQAMEIRFINDASNVTGETIQRWNRTWLKTGGTVVAEGVPGAPTTPTTTSSVTSPRPMAARWRVGLGQVCAVAFTADARQAMAMADLVAGAPVDPRFSITCDAGSELRVWLDAAGPEGFINDLAAEVRLVAAEAAGGTGGPVGADDRVLPMRQTGPGHYEMATTAGREAVLAIVTVNGEVAGRIPVAGRYAREFDAVGNDEQAMADLASATGGGVVQPNQTGPIDLKMLAWELDLTPWLAFCGVVAVIWGLAAWKRAGAT